DIEDEHDVRLQDGGAGGVSGAEREHHQRGCPQPRKELAHAGHHIQPKTKMEFRWGNSAVLVKPRSRLHQRPIRERPMTLSARIGFTPSKIGSTCASAT